MSGKKLSYPCYLATLRRRNLKYPEIAGFEDYLTQHRGVQSREKLQVATCFLDFLRASGKQIVCVSQKDIDDFIVVQGRHYKRKTISAISSHLRTLFRYLFFTGTLEKDFSGVVHGPYMFRGERDPRYLKPWQVKQILASAHGSDTLLGKRNYAILVLLAVYGLRAVEIASLRLDDLYWKARKLVIRKRKCGDTLVLPMIAQVGQVLTDYLSIRPAVVFREVFLTKGKPHPLKPVSLGNVAKQAIARCGICVVHPGTHTFRFSNAQSLFQTERPLSEIAGILGHSNLTTTLGYLSFVTDPLREVAINDGEAMA